MPATSPCDISTKSVAKPLLSAHLVYILKSISAQSCASVPPEPDWISTNADDGSILLPNILLNSSSSSADTISFLSFKISSIELSSFSSIDTSSRTTESESFLDTSSNDFILFSNVVFSLLSFCESSKSDHTSSFDSSLSISFNLVFLLSIRRTLSLISCNLASISDKESFNS